MHIEMGSKGQNSVVMLPLMGSKGQNIVVMLPIKLKETKRPTWKYLAYTHTMHIEMGSKGQSIVVMLHIKIKGMKCRRTCKQTV